MGVSHIGIGRLWLTELTLQALGRHTAQAAWSVKDAVGTAKPLVLDGTR